MRALPPSVLVDAQLAVDAGHRFAANLDRIAVTHMELENDAGELIATGGAAYIVG